ncbi:MAG: hypothetical protein JST53_13125 [Actinobacteria bacterium]|nr:hypothetical protein [Actinomycetota bacterium]
MGLFGKHDDESGAPVSGPGAGDEIARLRSLPLARLAAEVMEKAFAGEGPGAPGRPGTIEAPGLSAERVRLPEVARAVTPALAKTSDAGEQLAISDLLAEGIQALDLAGLVMVTWRGGTEDFRATRRGREAQSSGEVETLVGRVLG